MPEAEVETNETPEPRRKKLVSYLIVAGLMLGEGVGIFAAMRLMGSGSADSSAAAPEPGASGAGQTTDKAVDIELPICELDAFNNRSGKLLLYHIEIVARVNKDMEAQLKETVESHRARIHDRVNTVIRGADPQFLSEPGLETVRRQVKFELDKVFGDEQLIKELLVPKLLQS